MEGPWSLKKKRDFFPQFEAPGATRLFAPPPQFFPPSFRNDLKTRISPHRGGLSCVPETTFALRVQMSDDRSSLPLGLCPFALISNFFPVPLQGIHPSFSEDRILCSFTSNVSLRNSSPPHTVVVFDFFFFFLISCPPSDPLLFDSSLTCIVLPWLIFAREVKMFRPILVSFL